MDTYWRGKGGIVRCREQWINIGEGREGLSSVENYEWVLEWEGVSELELEREGLDRYICTPDTKYWNYRQQTQLKQVSFSFRHTPNRKQLKKSFYLETPRQYFL